MKSDEREDSHDEVVAQLKALGYIDPGTGSSMWQIILAGFFKLRAAIRKFFGGSEGEEEEE